MTTPSDQTATSRSVMARTTVEPTEGAKQSARACKDFFTALHDEGFATAEAVQIVAAWMNRPVGMDAAGMNAIIQNMAETLTGEQ